MAAPVADPAVQLERLHVQITEALAEVRGAEAAVEHCPSGENEEFLTAARYRLDRLIDRLPRQREA